MDTPAENMISSGGWLDPAARPWCTGLEAQADAILAELRRLLAREVWIPWGTAHYTPTFTRMSEAELLKAAADNPEHIGSGDEPTWRLFGLFLKGRRIERGCALCPRTAAAVARVPRLVNAGFSCLEAGYRLRPHRGYDPTLYRAHLGLIVPPGDCGLRVSGETRRWEAGKMLMFDDTHLHEAWNETPEHRVVLIVDTANHRAED